MNVWTFNSLNISGMKRITEALRPSTIHYKLHWTKELDFSLSLSDKRLDKLAQDSGDGGYLNAECRWQMELIGEGWTITKAENTPGPQVEASETRREIRLQKQQKKHKMTLANWRHVNQGASQEYPFVLSDRQLQGHAVLPSLRCSTPL